MAQYVHGESFLFTSKTVPVTFHELLLRGIREGPLISREYLFCDPSDFANETRAQRFMRRPLVSQVGTA